MDHPRHKLFAGARLAGQQDTRVGWRHLAQGLINLDHPCRASDHLGLWQIVDFRFAIQTRRALNLSLGLLNRMQQIVQLKGLGEILKGSAPSGGHHRLHAATRTHQDHATLTVGFFGSPQNIQPRSLIQVNIANYNRVRCIEQLIHGRTGARHGIHLVTFQVKKCAECISNARVVFNEQ